MPLCDIESSKSFSVPSSLYISVLPFKSIKTGESVYQRDHCSLGLALGKYNTVTKRWLGTSPFKEVGQAAFFKKKQPNEPACEWIIPNSLWWCPLRGEVPMCDGLCSNWSFVIKYVDDTFSLHFMAIDESKKTKQFTLIPKITFSKQKQ